MRKRDELSDPNSCTNKAADDEPLFVLRGHDPAAPAAVRAWVSESIARGLHADKLYDAEAAAVVMEAWSSGREAREG